MQRRWNAGLWPMNSRQHYHRPARSRSPNDAIRPWHWFLFHIIVGQHTRREIGGGGGVDDVSRASVCSTGGRSTSRDNANSSERIFNHHICAARLRFKVNSTPGWISTEHSCRPLDTPESFSSVSVIRSSMVWLSRKCDRRAGRNSSAVS